MIFIMNFTPSNFQIFKLIPESILSTPLFKMECEKMKRLIWTQGVRELIITQEFDLSQVKTQELRLVQEMGPNQEVKTQVDIHFPTVET